jgi:hypothetical protein
MENRTIREVMKPAGFMYKKVEKDNDLPVDDIYCYGGCTTVDFAEFIPYCKHNKYYIFDNPELMQEIAKLETINLNKMLLLYYEIYELQFREVSQQWEEYSSSMTGFPLENIQIPVLKKLEGFDVTCFSGHSSPECSPLSCSHLAQKVSVNRHCLFSTFEEAKSALENDLFNINNSEPGPFRITAIYSLPAQ